MIKQMLYNYFSDRNEKKEQPKEVHFAPSYLTKCKRQIFYSKTGAEQSNPITEASYLKMEMGTAIHDKLQDILKDIGVYVEGEDLKEIIWNDLKWLYRIDGLLEINNHKYLLEIKTIYGAGFRMIENQAKEDHELQLLLYMIFENIERGMIIYIGRDNGFIVEYEYSLEALREKYKTFMQNKLIELKKLKGQIENDTIPGKDHNIVIKRTNDINTFSFQKDSIKHKSDWQCSYCSHMALCWADELEEIINHQFYIDGEFIN